MSQIKQTTVAAAAPKGAITPRRKALRADLQKRKNALEKKGWKFDFDTGKQRWSGIKPGEMGGENFHELEKLLGFIEKRLAKKSDEGESKIASETISLDSSGANFTIQNSLKIESLGWKFHASGQKIDIFEFPDGTDGNRLESEFLKVLNSLGWKSQTQLHAEMLAEVKSDPFAAFRHPAEADENLEPQTRQIEYDFLQKIAATNSCGIIGDKGTIKKPFDFEGKKYVAMSSTSSALTGYTDAAAYQVIPESEFKGKTYFYGEKKPKDDEERATFYHGMKVKQGKENYVLSAPKIKFAVKQTPSESLLSGEPPEGIPGDEKRVEARSGDESAAPANNSGSTEIIFAATVIPIAVSKIAPSPFEPQSRRRAKFKTDDLDSLGASIEKYGLLQPILVRPRGFGRYEAVYGERRLLACERKNLPKINCFVRDLTDAQVLELQYEENHRRLDKDPLEDAFFFKFLIETEGYTSERIADRFDLNAGEVRRLLKLNDLIREAKEELSLGTLPLKHAVYLASFPADSQKEITRAQLAYKYHDREEKATSFDDFKAQVDASIIRRLADAPFDPYDTRLHWSGLVCADCSERSGFPGQLFPDLAKDDSCLNKYCYDWKDKKSLILRRDSIAAQMPNPQALPIEEKAKEVPLVTARQWTDEKVPFVEKVLTNQKFLPEPECEFSEISLIVAGERKGKETFICRSDKCQLHNQTLQADLSELKKKEDAFNRKVALLAREKVFSKAIEFFDDYKPVWMFDDLIQELLVRLWHSCGCDTRKPILRIIKDWKNLPDEGSAEQIKEFIASLNRRRQSQLIFLFVHTTTGFYQNDNQDGVRKIATDYTRRDYRLFDAEARFELAPTEFKSTAKEYLDAVKNGIEAEPPAFFWGFDEESAGATALEVE